MLFQRFAAPRALPGRTGCLAALQEIPQQPAGFVKMAVLANPYAAHVQRKLAYAAGQRFTTNQRLDAAGFQKSANQVSLCKVPGRV